MLEINVDGACSGNPGEAAIGVVIRRDGQIIKEIAKPIGSATNNIAEYMALIYALQEALIQKEEKVKVITDSELVFKQVTGQYKVKNPTIRLLFDQVKHLKCGFKRFDIEHVLREHNKDADRLATSVLKKSEAKVVASLFEFSGEESPSSEG